MIKASRDSAAYQLDAASSPDQLDTSRFVPSKNQRYSSSRSRRGRQPASKQKQTAGGHRKKNKKGTQIRNLSEVTPARLFCAFLLAFCVLA